MKIALLFLLVLLMLMLHYWCINIRGSKCIWWL